MRKFLMLPLLALVLFAQAGNNSNLLEDLLQVNAEWQNQRDVAKVLAGADIDSQNFNQWIAAHLMLTEQTLRSRDVSGLTVKQKQNRFILLDKLKGYYEAGVFPVNDYLPYKNPVFIDRSGTHCAVGFLMQQSGNDKLAQSINAAEKFAYVHQIKTPGVKEWANENGFTVEELAWIQPGYPPTIPCYDLDKGFNGPVNAIVADTNAQVVYAAGAFTASTSGTSCANVAAWISGFAGWDWVPVGSGLNGPVHTLLLKDNKLYAGGEFTMAGTTSANHVAVYDISAGQWQAVGSLDSTVRALTFYNGSLYAGGNFTGFVSKWNGTTWQDVTQGFIYGEGVRTLEVLDTLLIIGGSFELATGALRKNVATYDGSQMGTMGFGTTTAVNDFEVFNGRLFAGCDSTAQCAVAVYNNSGWQIILKDTVDFFTQFGGYSVKCLAKADTTMLVGGDFHCSTGSAFGYGLMAYYPTVMFGQTTLYDVFAPLANLDSSVNSICQTSSNTFFGGKFIENDSWTPGVNSQYNRIANFGSNMSDYTGIKEQRPDLFGLYPNPANDILYLKSAEEMQRIELYDVMGKLQFTEPVNSMLKSISIAQLPAGAYFIKAGFREGVQVRRFIKE